MTNLRWEICFAGFPCLRLSLARIASQLSSTNVGPICPVQWRGEDERVPWHCQRKASRASRVNISWNLNFFLMLWPHWTMSWMGTFISSNCSRWIQDLFSHSQFSEAVCCCINCRLSCWVSWQAHSSFQTCRCLIFWPQQAIFTPRAASHVDIFSFPDLSFVNSRNDCVGKSQQISTKMLRSPPPPPHPPSDSQQLCHFQRHLQWITIPSHSDGFNWSSAGLIDHLHLSKCIEMCCWWIWGLGRD